MPQLIEELNIADGVRREAAVLAMKYFMDRSYDAIEPLLELLYTGSTNQSYNLTQTCYTTGGCTVNVTQGN